MSSVLMRMTTSKTVWFMVILAGLLGIAPDVIGWIGTTWYGSWELYLWAHHSWYLYLVPFWNLHIFLDFLTHYPTGGWAWWAYPLEVMFWIIEFVCIIYWWRLKYIGYLINDIFGKQG
jgi:hypothetical protein